MTTAVHPRRRVMLSPLCRQAFPGNDRDATFLTNFMR
jgi:hypothetical protein